MGKSGDLLRQQKKQKAVYTFTGEQLKQHDDFVKDQIREQLKSKYAEMVAEANKQLKAEAEKAHREVDEEWDRRNKAFSNRKETEEMMKEILQLYLATSADILVNHFGFTPLTSKSQISRNRLAKFGMLLIEKLNVVFADGNCDLNRYNEECYEKYGIKFELATDDSNEEVEND